MKKILQTTAALMLMMTMPMLTSCTIEDNPAPTTDYGQWNVPETDMDTSVRPGDDFFMYCNGGYWNSTVIDESSFDFKSIMAQEIPTMMGERLSALPFPNYEKLLADAAQADSAEIMDKINAALVRINAVTTCEEAWKLWGELINEGYATSFGVNLVSRNGHIDVTLWPKTTDYAPIKNTIDKKSLEWQLISNPDLLANVHPLKGGGSRRAYDHDKWPMLTTIFTELSFNLDDACSIDMNPNIDPEYIEDVLADMLALQSDLDRLKQTMAMGVARDTALVRSKTRMEMVQNCANSLLKYEKSYIFTNAYITPEMKQRTMDYCIQLRQTFNQRIAANEWMSDASKQLAKEKLNAMTFNIGSPDEWFSEGFADISNEKTLLDDIMALRRTNLALCRKIAGMETPRASFHSLMTTYDLTVMNAFYSPNFNAMNIYPAWMLPPLLDSQQNDAHNYATMMVFGHEITHGFDTKGAKFNKLGDREDIWASDADRQEFQNRAQQLIDCYSNFEIMPWALPNVKNDGAYTIAENIADLGGVLLAYDTYVRHLTESGFKGEQFELQRKRFFLAIAKLWQSKYTAKYALLRTTGEGIETANNKDTHSLPRERINGTVTNIDVWYDLFDVKAGDKLYRAPEDRIRIW